MNCVIDFCTINQIGKIRKNNEDNFYAQGRYRREDEPLNDIVVQGSLPSGSGEILAVYDGMGGSTYGEGTSLIAKANRMICKSRMNVEIFYISAEIPTATAVYDQGESERLL